MSSSSIAHFIINFNELKQFKLPFCKFTRVQEIFKNLWRLQEWYLLQAWCSSQSPTKLKQLQKFLKMHLFPS